jgi:hypothetical protein
MIEHRISELVRVGERLACQLAGEFKIDRRKLRDFMTRAQASDAPKPYSETD